MQRLLFKLLISEVQTEIEEEKGWTKRKRKNQNKQ
jgi:hypothetical protein